jgi:TPR repeat protein
MPSGAACPRIMRRRGSGTGVPQDNVRAYMWYGLAAEHSTGASQKLAADKRDEVAGRMTPAQIAEVQQLEREWTPKGK